MLGKGLLQQAPQRSGVIAPLTPSCETSRPPSSARWPRHRRPHGAPSPSHRRSRRASHCHGGCKHPEWACAGREFEIRQCQHRFEPPDRNPCQARAQTTPVMCAAIREGSSLIRVHARSSGGRNRQVVAAGLAAHAIPFLLRAKAMRDIRAALKAPSGKDPDGFSLRIKRYYMKTILERLLRRNVRPGHRMSHNNAQQQQHGCEARLAGQGSAIGCPAPQKRRLHGRGRVSRPKRVALACFTREVGSGDAQPNPLALGAQAPAKTPLSTLCTTHSNVFRH